MKQSGGTAMAVLTRPRGIRRFLSLINLAAAAVLLSGCQILNPNAASGDSEDTVLASVGLALLVLGGSVLGAENSKDDAVPFTAPRTNPIVEDDDGNGDGMIPIAPTETPNIGISAPLTAQEGGDVLLIVTADRSAPADLEVVINIGGNGVIAGEFTTNPAATCPNLVCTVIIPAGNREVRFILSPTSDFTREGREDWTATLVDGDDYNLAANRNVDFAITDLIADIGIITSDTAVIEGGAIALTITSSIDAPDGGLSVTVNIGGDAVAADFTSAACTNTQCVVLIPTGMRSVVLIITPLDDDAPEGGSEDWTATIVADDDDIFMVDSDANVALIAVANVLPPVVDTTDLDDLNTYATQTPLAAAAIRDGGDDDIAANAITGFQYDDAGGTRVLVERLEFGHLGIWINGDIADADFDFAHLDENVVPAPTRTSNLAEATYALEGEMTYNGNRFYPDGTLVANFANARIGGEISLDGAEAADDFGGTTLADGTPIADDDDLTLGLGDVSDATDFGVISSDAFNGNLRVATASGFFASLNGVSTGTYSGRFNDDATTYDAATAAPQEVSGIFGGITDANGNELNGGFLGQCSVDCRLPIIGVSSATRTAEEGSGNIVLVITSDLAAPATGLAVDINIGGSGVTANEFTFTSSTGPVTCTDLLVCTVTIPATMLMVELTLTPIADFDTENTESWTATLEDLGGYDLATNFDFDFTITDLTADIGITTLDTAAEEGGAIALTITSSINALAGGLTVTVDISGTGVIAADISSANCNELACEVVILSGTDSVVLNLMPSTTDSVENIEQWTATIAPATNIFMVDSNANDADFSITDPTFPTPENGRTLAELMPLATPTAVSANAIRNRRSESINGAAITGSRYDDASGMPQIYVQMLEFAALGIWVDGNAPEIGVDDYDYDYAFLGDNVVNSPAMTDGRGSATYNVEGDATYRGLNFFPDGSMAADFDMRTFRLVLEAGDGGGAFDRRCFWRY